MKKLLLLALTASAIGGTAAARNREIVSLDNSVSVAYRLVDLHYMEPSDTCALAVCTNAMASGYFDRESGTIKGFRLSSSRLDFRGRLYSRLVYGWASGYVAYEGYTQSGTAISNGVSGAVISDDSIRLGSAFSSGSALIIPFVQYGHHAWRRLVGANTAQAYEEDYRHDYVGLGGLFQIALTQTLVGSLYVLAGQTLNPSISVPSLGFAQNLGVSALVKAGALLDLRMSRALGFYGGVRYTRFSYGQSLPQQSGNLIIMEPQSNTVIVSYEGGVRFLF